ALQPLAPGGGHAGGGWERTTGRRIELAPSEGGELLLVSGEAASSGGAGRIRLLDRESGADLGGLEIEGREPVPFHFVAAAPGRGRMTPLALALEAAPGGELAPRDLAVLPLFVAAPPPAPLVENGGFEAPDAGAAPPGWQLQGPRSARCT